MTLMEAIVTVDNEKPNSFSEAEKIRWLSVLDGMIKLLLIDMHEGGKEMCFDGYTEQTHQTCKLLVPPPYDDIYIHWLEAHIDYAGGEYEKYNNSISLFNTTYEAYAKYSHRTHKPISEGYVNF